MILLERLGNADPSEVLSGKTFTSQNATRPAHSGTLRALRLEQLFSGTTDQYRYYQNMTNGYGSGVQFRNTQAEGTPVYIRYRTSSGFHEAWCRVGSSLTEGVWNFDITRNIFNVQYNGTSTGWIQVMAYGMTFAHGEAWA